MDSSRYTLTAENLMASRIWLNGKELKLQATGDLPSIEGVAAKKGKMSLAPASITFMAVAKAGNGSCR